MSLYTSRYNITLSKNSNPSTLSSSCQFTANKRPDVSGMFLDQKTIVRKLQKLMLDVKDLETKMFISRTISYIQQGPSLTSNFFRPRDVNVGRKGHIDQPTNLQGQQKNAFLNSNQHMRMGSLTNTMTSSLVMPPMNNESSFANKNEKKFLTDTSAGQSFFPTPKNQTQANSSAIQDDVSESGTVQCQCGLFDGLLQMVQILMEKGLINKRQSEEEALQIDQAFIKQITNEITQRFQTVQKKLKSLSQRVTVQLSNKQAINHQLGQQLKLVSQQFETLRQNAKECTYLHSGLMEQNHVLRQQKEQIYSKLSLCLKQIQTQRVKRLLIQENKNHEIQSLKFEIQLKDSQISNLKTIIESLQKRTKQYDEQIYSMRKIQEQTTKKAQESVICYSFKEPDFSVTLTQDNESNCNKYQNSKSHPQKQNKHPTHIMRVENDQLKQQCILLYQKINELQLSQYL